MLAQRKRLNYNNKMENGVKIILKTKDSVLVEFTNTTKNNCKFWLWPEKCRIVKMGKTAYAIEQEPAKVDTLARKKLSTKQP